MHLLGLACSTLTPFVSHSSPELLCDSGKVKTAKTAQVPTQKPCQQWTAVECESDFPGSFHYFRKRVMKMFH